MSKCECKNCVHESVCRIREFPSIDEILKDGCNHYKDKSLVVELPCKVGDDLFVISQMRDKRILPFISEFECTSITIRKRSVTVYHEMDGFIKIFKKDDFGKTVFLTKEQAEEKLKEIEGK